MRVFRFCIWPRRSYAWLRQDKKRRRAARKERREHRRDLLFNRATAAAAAGGGGGGAGLAEDGANSNVSSKVRASAEVFLSEVLGVGGAAPAVAAPKLAPNKVALTNIVAGVLDHNERVQEEGDAAAHRRLVDLNSEHTHTLATPLPPPTYQPPSHASQATNRPQHYHLPPCYDGSGGGRVPPPNAGYNAGSTAPYNAPSSYYHQRASGGAWEAYQAYDQTYGGASGVTRHARHVSRTIRFSLQELLLCLTYADVVIRNATQHTRRMGRCLPGRRSRRHRS